MAQTTLATTPAVPRGTIPARVLLIPLLVVAAAVPELMPLPQGTAMQPWLLGLALGSLVLILNSRAWLVVPLLISELSVANYVIPQWGMSLRLAVALVGLAAALPVILGAGFADPRLRRVLLPSVWLVALATVMDFVTSGSTYAIKYLRYQATQVLILVLVAAVIRRRQEVKGLAIVALLLGALGAFAAITQHYAMNVPFVPAAGDGRVGGFSDDPVALALQMLFVMVPLIGVLVAGRWRFNRLCLLLGALAILLFAGMYVSETRSGLIGLAVGLLAIGLCLRGRHRWQVLGFVVGALILYELLAGTGIIKDRYYAGASTDSSAATHDMLLQTGIAIALQNPFTGIGHQNFEEAATAELQDMTDNSSAVVTDRPHDDFLSVWLSWGIVALAAYIAIFIGSLRNYLLAVRHPDPLIRNLAIGCIGGLAAYAAHSAFHNSLDSSTLLWIYAGVSVALARLSPRAGRAPRALRAPAR